MRTFSLSTIAVALTILTSVPFSFQINNPYRRPRFEVTKLGRKVHDNFYQIVESKIPVEDALNQALTWDVQAQYEHFDLLEAHVAREDEYAEYCQQIIKEAQNLLDVTLEKIGIKPDIGIREYVQGLYDFEAGRLISEKMQRVIAGINAYRDAAVKKLEAEQVRARAEAEGKTQEAEIEEAEQAQAEEAGKIADEAFQAQDAYEAADEALSQDVAEADQTKEVGQAQAEQAEKIADEALQTQDAYNASDEALSQDLDEADDDQLVSEDEGEDDEQGGDASVQSDRKFENNQSISTTSQSI